MTCCVEVSTVTGAIWSCDTDCDGFVLVADDGGIELASVCVSETLSETVIRMEEGFDEDCTKTREEEFLIIVSMKTREKIKNKHHQDIIS